MSGFMEYKIIKTEGHIPVQGDITQYIEIKQRKHIINLCQFFSLRTNATRPMQPNMAPSILG